MAVFDCENPAGTNDSSICKVILHALNAHSGNFRSNLQVRVSWIGGMTDLFQQQHCI